MNINEIKAFLGILRKKILKDHYKNYQRANIVSDSEQKRDSNNLATF